MTNKFTTFIKRLLCKHDIDDSTLVGKVKREDVPVSDKDWIYVENKRLCKCGKVWYDNGAEPKVGMRV